MASPLNGTVNPLASLRRLVIEGLRKPVPEFLHESLTILVEALDAQGAFLGRVEDDTLEFVDALWTSAGAPAKGERLPLDQTMVAAAGDQVINLRDASKRDGYRRTEMCKRLNVTGYLAVPVSSPSGSRYGTLAVLAKGPRDFGDEETDLLLVVAGLLGERLAGGNNQSNRGIAPFALRLASQQVNQPLAIIRGYAEMLSRNEVPGEQMALVAKRLLLQSETIVRTVDEMMVLAHLPLQLTFTVRVSLPGLMQAAAGRVRARAEAAGMELRLQIDVSGQVWGDPTLLEAALDEMVNNVFEHAQGASVLQLRLRQSSPDRFQLIVKDDGQGISAERLADLFSSTESEREPVRGEGLGLYLLRRVARAHGGSTWANSLEGKGTTFYLELPAASPDGESARASSSVRAPA